MYPNVNTAILTTAKTWKQPKGPMADEWIKKMRYIYTMECYSVIKMNEICHLQQPGWTYRL